MKTILVLLIVSFFSGLTVVYGRMVPAPTNCYSEFLNYFNKQAKQNTSATIMFKTNYPIPDNPYEATFVVKSLISHFARHLGCKNLRLLFEDTQCKESNSNHLFTKICTSGLIATGKFKITDDLQFNKQITFYPNK